MYKLSRLLLIIGVLLVLYSVAVIGTLGWPWMACILLYIFIAMLLRRRTRRLTTLGSARWADESDLRRAGILDAETGLILGQVHVARNTFRAIRKLFNPRIAAASACGKFWGSARRSKRSVARLPNAIHTSVYSPSGGGKGVSCVIPFLLTCDESCVVIDFKGENANLTAEHRRKVLGHQVVILDPYKQVSKSPDTFNPLAFIDKDSLLAIDECNDLAKALVMRTGDEKEPHWNDSAEAWIAAMIATVVQYGEPENGTRSLQTVRDLISHPQKLEMAIKLMGESDAWGGMLARMGGQLAHFVEKEKSSTLTTVSRHLRFLDTIAVAENTKSSSFDPAGLRTGKMTIYLVLPPDHMRAQSALLRMWIGSMLRAVIRGGLQEKNKVHFILDEAASLGHLEAVDDAVDKYRGYGVRLQLYYQSLGQLKKCFPDGQEQTLLSNTTHVFFGVNDTATAEYVSNRLGEETIIVDSGGTSSGSSRQVTEAAQTQNSAGSSDNANSNWQQQARKLLKPEEVMMLSPREAITFTPGVPPMFTTLIRYYEEKNLGKRPGWFSRWRKACMNCLAAALFCFLALFLAFLMTLVADHEHDTRGGSPRAYQQATQAAE